MAVVARVDPDMFQLVDIMRDEARLDQFCEEHGLAPRTQPPGAASGARGSVARNPMYGRCVDLGFNPARPQCTGTVTKTQLTAKKGGFSNQMRPEGV